MTITRHYHGRAHSVRRHVSAMDIDSLDVYAQQADAEEHGGQQPTEATDQPSAASSSCVSGPRPELVLQAEVPTRLVATEDAKSEEYYKVCGQIRGALDQLGEQLQQDIEAL